MIENIIIGYEKSRQNLQKIKVYRKELFHKCVQYEIPPHENCIGSSINIFKDDFNDYSDTSFEEFMSVAVDEHDFCIACKELWRTRDKKKKAVSDFANKKRQVSALGKRLIKNI